MLDVGGTPIGGTPDLVLVCSDGDGKIHLKLIDFKSGKLTESMRQELRASLDCKLGNVSVQLSLYAFMLETLFENVVVDEAVAVFCHEGGFSEYAVSRSAESTVIAWLSAYTQRVHNAGSTSLPELRVVDFGNAASRVPPSRVTGLPPTKAKGRPRKRPLDFMAGQPVETAWGPAVLVEACKNGWNVDFGEEYTNNFWLSLDQFAACPAP